MLVVRRKVGEAIRISDNIRIVIHEIQHGQVVRFGIDAPDDIPVHRLEVYEQIQQENKSAVAGDTIAWLKQGE